jgi:hypothetical protein
VAAPGKGEERQTLSMWDAFRGSASADIIPVDPPFPQSVLTARSSTVSGMVVA